MRLFLPRGGSRAMRAVLVLALLLGGVVAYLACLVAIHLSVVILERLAPPRTVDPRVQRRSDGLRVGLCVGLSWGLAVGLLLLARFGTAPIVLALALVIGLALGGTVGWQVGIWRRAAWWERQRATLNLGHERRAPFFVAHPYLIVGPQRLKHLAICGATGSGKSTLLQGLIVRDIERGAGLCVVDPKDDLVDRVLAHVPPEREDDVILLDATDVGRPLGFNPLAGVDPRRRSLAAAELLAVFRRSFADSWGSRMEHILSNVLLALLEVPDATLLDVPRLLLEESFRRAVLARVSNVGVRHFFLGEYETLLRNRPDALQPILNKVGPWLAYPELRGIIGQPRSSFDIRRVMDEGKILLVRIPQGALGENVSQLLGALVVAKVQLAAQSRVDLAPERRRAFTLYVDEFQNFATSSFSRILAEARGFGLGLVCANQYEEQLSQELRLAIRRNVATLVQCHGDGGRHHLAVTRLQDTGPQSPPVVLVPPAPVPPGDPRRAAHVRARSRARHGRAPHQANRQAPGAPRRGAPRGGAAGTDVDEE